MININLLVATIDAGLERVGEMLLEPRPDLVYIVSQQYTDERYCQIPATLQRPDVQISQLARRGLARNRNNALDLATGDVALLADDDAHYRDRYFDLLQRVFSAEDAPDLACFKIATPPGEPPYKEYSAEPYSLNERSGHYISSLEIAFKLEAVRAKGIRFDERFGLASGLIELGEEAVFIFDCLQAGLQGRYLPEDVVEHGLTSSVNKAEPYARERNIFKGAYDARRYGWKAWPAALIASVRLRRDLLKYGVKPLTYLGERLHGARLII